MYQPSWNSLRTHTTPKWLQEGKFGIYTHWGVYSVPGCGPNGSWYPYNMYRKGTPQYEYHEKHYGNISKFGYKDLIPLFTGEKFDPEQWAEMFKNAGAAFAGPVGEHHDGFSMWKTDLNKWNAYNMGPKRDIVAELEKAIRSQKLKYMVALHHAENWKFYSHWVPDCDLSDPAYYSLYGYPHNMEWADGEPDSENWPVWNEQEKPDEAFLNTWYLKIKEVIDKFRPDLLWFDFGLEFVQESYKRDFLAYYYNQGEKWGKEVIMTYKFHDMAPFSGLIDLEQGQFDTLTYHDWLTDTTVDDGEGWSYIKGTGYKSAAYLIHYLIDNVSKNGYLLLNVGPKPTGEIPEEAEAVLKEMGRWLALNGEAIYGTTPWLTFGEGPTKMKASGMFSDKEKIWYTEKDIRYTAKEDTIYAICLGYPTGEVVLTSLKSLYESEIKKISMLGMEQPLLWRLDKKALTIQPPEKCIGTHAYVFKIERKHPFELA